MSKFNLHNLQEEQLTINFLQSIITILCYLIVIVVIGVSLFMIEYEQEDLFKARIEYLTGQYNEVIKINDKSSPLLEQKIFLLKNLYYRKWKIVNLLNDIHKILRDDINLNKLQIKYSTIIIDGAASNPVSIANMLILLHNSRVL